MPVNQHLPGQTLPPRAVPTWIAALLALLPGGGRVLDLGCGVPVARDLAAAGHRVTGVDISDFQPNGHCTVFADPAGHAFYLSTWGNRAEARTGQAQGAARTMPTTAARRPHRDSTRPRLSVGGGDGCRTSAEQVAVTRGSGDRGRAWGRS